MTVATPKPVRRHQFANGLEVLLREDHAAPIVSCWVFYRVGSRNELPGQTGSSHWVEHMQFKGTGRLAKGQIFRDVSRVGGTLNALTSHDWTAYYETVPADHLDLPLSIEADRMVNSVFDPAETEAERTVILSERQGAENQPPYLLYEETTGAAFRAHPYRHAVIGHETDLRAISRDDLYAHYRHFYRPDNAVVVLVGHFAADDALARIERAFGDLPAGNQPGPRIAVEPPQVAERRVILRRPAPTGYLRMAYRVPGARHPDTPALLVLDAILSGGKPLGLGGGGGMGRSARLYRALVAGGLARSAGSDVGLHVDPYLLTVAATALPGVEPGRLEEAAERELERLVAQPVPATELARATKQVNAQYVYSAEGVTNQAFWLGFMEIVDRAERADALVAELEAVAADDLQRVAAAYLQPDQRTVGWLVPDGSNGARAERETAASPNFGLWGLTRNGPRVTKFERDVLPNGTVVIGQPRPEDPSLSVRLRFAGGAVAEPADKPGAALLTARSLLRGTSKRTFEAINAFTDDLGAAISADAGRHEVEISVKCLAADLDAMLALAIEIAADPTFPPEEVERVRRQIATGIREADQDTRATADRLVRRQLFPPPHPLGRRIAGDLDTIETLTRADLVAYAARHLGPNQLTVAIAGGFADVSAAASAVERALAGWDRQAAAPVEAPPPPDRIGASRVSAAIPSKSQADVALGLTTVSRGDPDYYAVDTANLILGRLGLMGRLGATVRDRQGLAYYASSGLEAGREGSVWVARAGVDPANIHRAIGSVLDELGRLAAERVAAEELADAKSYLVGILPLALETNDGVAATLLNIEYFGLGLDYVDRYPGIIRALTREDVQRAAQLHLTAERVAIAVAGPQSDPPAS